MSSVTDLVFILPNIQHTRAAEYRQEFEASFENAHGWRIHPDEEPQGKVMSTLVYVAGVNWICHDWIDQIVAGDWPPGTVLWMEIEGLMDQPNEIVIHQLGPKKASRG